jgi:hypothetical protein
MARNKQLICLRDQARSLRHIGTTGKSVKCCQVLFADAMHVFLEKTAKRAGLVLRYPRDERVMRCCSGRREYGGQSSVAENGFAVSRACRSDKLFAQLEITPGSIEGHRSRSRHCGCNPRSLYWRILHVFGHDHIRYDRSIADCLGFQKRNTSVNFACCRRPNIELRSPTAEMVPPARSRQSTN